MGWGMYKVLITTVPFGEKNRLPVEQLDAAGVEYLINPLGRKLAEEELAEMITDYDVLIAGTEDITDFVMSWHPSFSIDHIDYIKDLSLNHILVNIMRKFDFY